MMLFSSRLNIKESKNNTWAPLLKNRNPAVRNSTKIKKNAAVATIELVKNPDILAGLGAMHQRPFLVGFAAETNALAENAAKKLTGKNLDMIVANDVSQADAGFNVDTNRALLFFKVGSSRTCDLMSKDQLAMDILDQVVISKEAFAGFADKFRASSSQLR